MWHVLLVGIRNHLKSVLRYKFLILGTFHPDILYLRQQGCEDFVIFRSQKEFASKNVWEKLAYNKAR